MTAQCLDVLSQLLHLLLLNYEILPVQHLHLRLVFPVLEQGEQVVDLLVDGVLLDNYIILFFRELLRVSRSHRQATALRTVRIQRLVGLGTAASWPTLEHLHVDTADDDVVVIGDGVHARQVHVFHMVSLVGLNSQRVQILL